MIAEYKIYGLAEEGTGVIKYIGYTKQKIHTRLIQHKSCKLRRLITNWIKSIEKRVEIILIEDGIYTPEEAWQKEKDYILLFKSFGAVLKNMTMGGEGSRVFTDEVRSRIVGRPKELHPMYGRKGALHPRFGKSNSPEAIEKQRTKILGSKNTSAKLTEKDVMEVLSFVQNGMSTGKVAKMKGVTPNAIQSVVKGRSWSHITNIPKPIRVR